MNILLALLALMAFKSTDDAIPGPSNDLPTGVGADGYRVVAREVDKLARLMRWGPETTLWAKRMFSVQAHSESRGNTTAMNPTPGERAAAQRIYERMLQKDPQLMNQAPAADWYGTFGSGGLYGLIPATYASTFSAARDDDRAQISPSDIFDPWRATVGYLKYLQGLTRWRQFRDSPQPHNAYTLKRGGAAPSLMDDPDAPRSIKSHENLDRASRALGFPVGWADAPIPEEFYTRPPSYWDLLVNGEEDARG